MQFLFKAPSTELRNAWVDLLCSTVKSVVEVGGSTNSASRDYNPQQREFVIASLTDVAKGPDHLLGIFQKQMALRCVSWWMI